MNSTFSKGIIVGLLSLFLLTATSFQSAYAIDKSRVFVCLLFLSGLGSGAAGALMKDEANELYDQYLHTAVKPDMERLLDDYEQKDRQSIAISRVGMGLVAGAILLSLIDAAYIPPIEVMKEPGRTVIESRTIGNGVVATLAPGGGVFFTAECEF